MYLPISREAQVQAHGFSGGRMCEVSRLFVRVIQAEAVQYSPSPQLDLIPCSLLLSGLRCQGKGIRYHHLVIKLSHLVRAGSGTEFGRSLPGAMDAERVLNATVKRELVSACLGAHHAGDEVPSYCCKRKHISTGLSWQDQAVHVLGYEAGVQLGSLKGRVLAQALQKPHICRQPTHLQKFRRIVI